MARTKAFDPAAAIEAAMQTFWARGYAATSAQDLVDAVGLSRSSLYGTFGSKAELYARALERYRDTVQAWTRSLLDGPGPLRRRLPAALHEAVAEDLEPARSRGCFACNAAVELGPVDPTVRRLVTSAFDDMRATFRQALVRARNDGELGSHVDVDALATLLLAGFEGLRVLAKGTQDRGLVEQAIDTMVTVLDLRSRA
jgi:TetR/AcrR family transcriptional repressor of nem operon